MTKTSACLAVLVLAALPLNAEIIICGGQADQSPVPGASLSNVRMGVSLAVNDGLALFRFTNISELPETSAVLEEIVIDGIDSDSGTAVLWEPVILTHDDAVSFDLAKSNGLPGYNEYTKKDSGMFELQANASPVQNGLGLGESLMVQFRTSLQNGAGLQEYLDSFGGGSDASNKNIGFHAISSSIMGGSSLSGMETVTTVPEPACAAMLLAGAGIVLSRQMRKQPAIIAGPK